jgi:sugar lactone lactonase YvrE
MVAVCALATYLAGLPAQAVAPLASHVLESRRNQAPAAGDPVSRLSCPQGFEAHVYATGLTSPHGLAFGPNGILYVAEEYAGRVSSIQPDGSRTVVVSGLSQPQGITVDPAGNLYVMEDVQDGRLLRVEPDNGQQVVVASNLDAPEGIVWSPDGQLYITESNVQFAENVPWDVVSGVSRVSLDGTVTKVFTDTLLWSYSALTLGADGLLYVANEASNIVTTDSIFRVEPGTGVRTLFASELTAPEGLAFSAGGGFPLYATEEDVGDRHGRLSLVRADGTTVPLCTGFNLVEDVAVDPAGNLYVSEDVAGLIIKIIVPDLGPPGPPRNLQVEPPEWTTADGFTLTWENPVDPSGIAGAYLKVGEPPAFITDGTFYAGQGLSQITGIAVMESGLHTAHLWLEDGVGNANPGNAATASLGFDPDAPDSPVNLAVDPPAWSPTNIFTLTWTNPPEQSGVVTACYRLDSPPVDAADFDACQSGTDIQALTGISMPDSGQFPVWIWLADAAGNVDPSTASGATVRHDAVAPASVASAPSTARTAPIRVTWVATDTLSGVDTVALWVRNGEGGTWRHSGLEMPGAVAGFFLFEPEGEGRYAFATQATDRAANSEAQPSGEGDAQTLCQTWQRVYLPLLWREGP